MILKQYMNAMSVGRLLNYIGLRKKDPINALPKKTNIVKLIE
jgi:hypothetical protein